MQDKYIIMYQCQILKRNIKKWPRPEFQLTDGPPLTHYIQFLKHETKCDRSSS